VFCDIKNRLDEADILKIMALSIFGESLERASEKARICREHDAQHVYGWIENDVVLGVCGFTIHSGKVEITNISVAKDKRKRGIGKAMIIALLKKHKMEIEAETDDDAVEFYRKCGFNITMTLQKHGIRRWKCVLPFNQNTIIIKNIDDADDKTAITLKIMHSLPAWFSPPDDIEKKALTHREYPFIAAFDDDAPVGFVALKIHNLYTADIFNLGVLESYHRQGIGRRLIEAAERYCLDNGYLYLTVKTLDSSAEYEPYKRTRAFYQKMGFIPLEVFKTFWNEENPCLFMAKWLDNKPT
jgi:ribosomal protein S18 acetylase RimI-like enzyme